MEGGDEWSEGGMIGAGGDEWSGGDEWCKGGMTEQGG
jgi:hypothetical protein